MSIDIAFRKVPFNHAIIAPVLGHEYATACLEILETASWKTEISDFYRIDVPISPQVYRDITPIIESARISILKHQLEECFGVRLYSVPQIDIQRYGLDSVIGPHTDATTSEIRVVVNINRTWNIDNSSFWILSSESMLSTDLVILPPIQDTGFAFVTSNDSYHALSSSNGKVSFGLIFIFRIVDNGIDVQGVTCL